LVAYLAWRVGTFLLCLNQFAIELFCLEKLMAVMRKRTRLVSFRLSEQEYEALQSYSMNLGARSISDFARMALCDVLETNRLPATAIKGHLDHPAPVPVALRQSSNFMTDGFEMLIKTMGELNRVISRLSILIESTNHSNGNVR
jgi:hypothetical protein